MGYMENNIISDEKVAGLVITVPTITTDDCGETAKGIFESLPEIEGLVVMEHGKPAGTIMRNMFFQKIGSKYGYSIYMKRPVSILMDAQFLSVDAQDSVSKVGLLAAGRGNEQLYDYIVVYQNKSYLGVISIRHFFEELSRRNDAQISVLKEQQRELISAHEQELKLRKNLEYQSSAVKNLLDHAEQGFLWFDSDLIIKDEVSYKCLEIFGNGVNGQRFTELVKPYFEADRIQVFAMAFESYFMNNSPVTDTVYLMLLPSDCVISGRSIHFQYKRIQNSRQKAVMVVMNDISDKVAMEKAMEEDRYRQRLLIKAFGAQPQIKRMLDEFRELFSFGFKSFFSKDKKTRESLDELFRAVHTYKGDFAQYGFDSASEKLHVLEDELSALMEKEGSDVIEELESIFSRIDSDEIVGEDRQVICEFLGSNYFEKSELISVPKSRLLEIEELLKRKDGAGAAEAAKALRSLLLRPVKASLEQYGDYLEYLSGRVMKSPPVFLVEGDDVEVDGDRFESFFHSLVHVFRNCMDHGIESDEERAEAGKEPRGCVHCVVSALDEQSFSIRISDDGCGINTERLKEKAVERGLCGKEEAKQMGVCDLFFADRLSSKDCVSSLSGRGAGMAAVQKACLDLGGSIDIETSPGQGTTFIMTLPY